MKLVSNTLAILLILVCASTVSAQKTAITISFTEQFFDALLDAVFQHAAPPEFSLAQTQREGTTLSSYATGFAPRGAACNESVRILRENAGVRTSVIFRDGQIVAPLAFKGNYNPPLIGCVPFAGVAETIIGLEFDRAAQRLIARAKVRDISLNGTGGIGGSIVARMLQGTIDKKINPIEIVKTDKVSFLLPLQSSTSVKMNATGFTHQVVNGQLDIRVEYEFAKAN